MRCKKRSHNEELVLLSKYYSDHQMGSEHGACWTHDIDGTYKVLVKQSVEIKQLAKLGQNVGKLLKICLKQIEWEDLEHCHFTQGRDQWQAVVYVILNLHVT